jgi:hypothetical protein
MAPKRRAEAGAAAPYAQVGAGLGKKARAGKEEAPAPKAVKAVKATRTRSLGGPPPRGGGKDAPAAPPPAGATGAAGVHLTSSKACQAFGKHVDKLKEALGKLRPGVAVEVDTQPKEGKNPDRGSFVVVVNGKTVLELRAMPRPFTAMKGLDMDEVARKVLAAL